MNDSVNKDRKHIALVFVALQVFVILALLSTLMACSVQGPAGQNGKDGTNGSQGPQGVPGVAATPIPAPSITTQPATAEECLNGGIEVDVNGESIGVVCNGAEGPQGAPGAPGADINPISIVQFCPGTTVYPSEFNEIGFCVAGTIYATYSANGGFSAEIPPGQYSSDGIGSSCNFTVLPNCVIKN